MTWEERFVPTLEHFAGAYDEEDGGWDIEKDKDEFRKLLQAVVDVVYPRVVAVVAIGDAIFRLVSILLLFVCFEY